MAAALEAEGPRLAEAAGGAGALGQPVPTCPGWNVSQLLRHLGYIHRWAARYVAERLPGRVAEADELAILSGGPADAALLAWAGDGHRALVAALRAAPPDLGCWTFLPAASSLAFWARRQLHETTIHRVDLEAAAGRGSAVAPIVAADGIDELLMGFAARSGRLSWEPGGSLSVHATDVPGDWIIRMGDRGRLAVTLGPAAAATAVAGPASALYRLLWNRRDREGLAVRGDPRLLDRWRSELHVTWS